MYRCKTGRHVWTSPEDAAKCCNGWHRRLRVAQTTLGETLPAEAQHVRHEAGAGVGYVWAPDDASRSEDTQND